MRLNLYWRGRDVVDVEVHVWKRRDPEPVDRGPALQARAALADTAIADPFGDPGTIVSFGFCASPGVQR